jgi:branched-chain amino acid transport system substrate-binding protein
VSSLLFLATAVALHGEEGEPPRRQRYADRPDALIPYDRVTIYKDFYTEPPRFRGYERRSREADDPDVDTVRIGFIGPLVEEDNPVIPENFRPGIVAGPKTVFGRNQLKGGMLAIDEANRDGGYRGREFRFVRRTDLLQWGQTSNELVQFAYEDRVWAILSSVDSNHNHVMNRATLKAEVPIVNAGSTDPTLTEHSIPWLVRCVGDDRLHTYEVLGYIHRVRGYTRIAVLRVNDRDGRVGVAELIKGARRLGTPVLLELRFDNGDTDFSPQLHHIRELSAEVVVLWANPPEAAAIVRQMRSAGMTEEVVAFDRVAHPLFLEAAGEAAEGVVAASPFNPQSDRPLWREFQARYRDRYGEEPDAFAAFGYDGANLIIQAIRRAGLNRIRIREALFALRRHEGVTGTILFDQNLSNVSRSWLAVVRNGEFHYFRPEDWERSVVHNIVLESEAQQ